MTNLNYQKNNFCILLDPRNNWIKSYLEDSSLEIDILYDFDKTQRFEVCFVLGYTKILDFNKLYPKCFYVTIHESDLPLGKGFSPIQWQILNDKKNINVCLIEIAKEVDSGDILLRDVIKFDGTELYDEIRFKQAKASISLIRKFIEEYPNFSREEQSGDESFFKFRNKESSNLDINKSIVDQFNLLRICNNEEWPAFFKYKGEKYIVKIFKESNLNNK